MKKLYELLTDTNKNTAEDITKTMILTSKENNKAILNLNDKLLEIRNNRGIIALFLISPLSEIINPGTTSQFKIVKDTNSNRVNDLLINKIKPLSLYNNLLTYRDKDKVRIERRSFEIDNKYKLKCRSCYFTVKKIIV